MTTENTPKARPIAPTTPINQLHPSRFLKAADLQAWRKTHLLVEIAAIQEEEVEPQPGKKEYKPVLYFKDKTGQTFPRGYLLSAKTDINALAAATGAATVGECTGKRITILLSSHKGKPVLRISETPPSDPTPPAE